MGGVIKWVVGIDEVGRGALAGPVMVAAALLAVDTKGRRARMPYRSLKDSKKLSARQRERWVKKFAADPHITFALARVYPRGIEKMNISAAANRAAFRAFFRLQKSYKLSADVPVYLDGGLFLKNRSWQAAQQKSAKTVIKADEKISAVAAASIMAKFSRDRFMTRLGKRYPAYGFEVHKGYGTAAHFKALQKSGSCEAHRLTFLTKPHIMNK